MFKVDARLAALSCLAMTLASCGNGPDQPITSIAHAEVVTAGRSSPNIQATSIATEFVKICIKLANDHSQIATRLNSAGATPITNSNGESAWKHKINGKHVLLSTNSSLHQQKNVKTCSVEVYEVDAEALLSQVVTVTGATKLAEKTTGGKRMRTFLLNSGGNRFMLMAIDAVPTGDNMISMKASLL